MSKIIAVIRKVNVSHVICENLLDGKHTDRHRMTVGVIIMGFGVGISKIHVELQIIHFFLDGIGYGIHGIGLTPFIERLTRYFSDIHASEHPELTDNKVNSEVKEEV